LLAEETGVHEIGQCHEQEETSKAMIDLPLLKPVFVNKKDREVMQVNQEHEQ